MMMARNVDKGILKIEWVNACKVFAKVHSAIEGLAIVLLLQYLLFFSKAKQGIFAFAVTHQ